jgi:hypothetical protein
MNRISAKNSRAGAWPIAGILLLFTPNFALGQPGHDESLSNVECLVRLETPEYPPLARQAGLQATQTVKVFLSDKAAVQKVGHSIQWKANNLRGKAADNTEAFFNDAADKAVKGSGFSKTCGGKTITLVFHYEIRDDPHRSSLFAFGPPNHFWIRYGPVYINP